MEICESLCSPLGVRCGCQGSTSLFHHATNSSLVSISRTTQYATLTPWILREPGQWPDVIFKNHSGLVRRFQITQCTRICWLHQRPLDGASAVRIRVPYDRLPEAVLWRWRLFLSAGSPRVMDVSRQPHIETRLVWQTTASSALSSARRVWCANCEFTAQFARTSRIALFRSLSQWTEPVRVFDKTSHACLVTDEGPESWAATWHTFVAYLP